MVHILISIVPMTFIERPVPMTVNDNNIDLLARYIFY